MADGVKKAPARYQLHETVFKGNHGKLKEFIEEQPGRSIDLGQKDIHGNTPLHLAVMLGHHECAHLLLRNDAPVKVKNSQGWTPLAEAISYGDRKIITELLRKLKQQSRDAMKDRRPKLAKTLKEMDDFYMELKWDFQSWIPLVSRLLPSDICKLTKRGCSIRVDTTLVDFNDNKWERGDICFIFNGDKDPSDSLVVLDNNLRVYQRARHMETDAEIEDEVDLLMSSDIVATRMSTKPITFHRAQSGWLFREDKSEVVGSFQSDFYIINGMNLESRKRREHLTDEDLQKNKAFMETFTKGATLNLDAQADIQRRHSLPPPKIPQVSWENYINATPGHPPHLGRPINHKSTSKSFKATVAMSQDFPVKLELLLNLLELTTPFKHLNKLREFVKMKLPPGFPVKIDIPILPTVTAKITFQEFKFTTNDDAAKFQIPADFKEDPNRFPDL